MKLYAPAYYLRFSCIADRCRHSCCVGWEIDVDSETMARYATLTDGYGKQITASIDGEGEPHFRLTEGERCPHLDERGLCRIITEYGDGYLCDICREHPRFYNDTAHGREVGLGMACEEASRLILSAGDYQSMLVLYEDDEASPNADFDAVTHRFSIYAVLSDDGVPYTERLQRIAKAYNLSLAVRSDAEWRELLSSLEYLHDEHRALFKTYFSDPDTPSELAAPLERALAYLVFRHGTAAVDEDDLRAAIGFCLFCERLLASMAKAYPTEDVAELARILSEELEYSEDNTDAIKLAFSI